MKPPPAYVRVEAGGSRAWVREGAASWARAALDAGETLHDWAARRPDARAMEGRGRVWNVAAPVPGPDGGDRWAVRHYRRGGSVAGPLLGDRYLVSPEAPRPFQELRCSEEARARGIPTPAVVAAAVYPAGLFYRADLITELVPHGVDLRDLLFGARGSDAGSDPGSGAGDGAGRGVEGPDAEGALEATGRLVRRMEAAGIYHPDMNAANVLLTGADPVRAWLLDLDRCQARGPGTPAPVGPMRDRLRRSLRKLQARAGRPLPEPLWRALERGLEEGA